MFKSFRVFLFFCVGFSVAQADFTEDYEIRLTDEYFNTEYPDYMFTPGNTEFPDYLFTTPSRVYMECAPNEILQCADTCHSEQTCRDHRQQVTTMICPEEEQSCEDKCVCEPGFFRNTENGVCVSEKQCDKCPGPHEHYACGGPCDNHCHTLHLNNKTSCPGYNDSDCQPSCYCDDGYARGPTGVCIPLHECPIPKCGKNEVFTKCKKSCLNETCSALMNPSICDSEEECGNLGCVCKEGYFRIEENAPCLPSCECPQKKSSVECWYSIRKFPFNLFKLGY